MTRTRVLEVIPNTLLTWENLPVRALFEAECISLQSANRPKQRPAAIHAESRLLGGARPRRRDTPRRPFGMPQGWRRLRRRRWMSPISAMQNGAERVILAGGADPAEPQVAKSECKSKQWDFISSRELRNFCARVRKREFFFRYHGPSGQAR